MKKWIVVFFLLAMTAVAGVICLNRRVPVARSASAPLDTITAWSPQSGSDLFAFAVTADMRNYTGLGQYDTVHYFRGSVAAIAALGGTAFMISPGDLDPPSNVLWTITRTLGTSYTWYSGVGNHELPGAGYEEHPGDNMRWMNSYDYGAVNPGPTGCPTTTYSFDYLNAHFVMLNEYCDVGGDDVTDGDIPDHLYNWLVTDLESTSQDYIFVLGHEPAYPQPDADNGRVRHLDDSLNSYPAHRDRFWALLRQQGVTAYICGHTHNYSAVRINGVWQLDAGHARGLGDTGARSTFIIIHVGEQTVRFDTYRDDAAGGPYNLMHAGYLVATETVYLPVILSR